ncbi:pentapeptide repeat-containing protein, partial [Mycobacterium tuberculosis]
GDTNTGIANLGDFNTGFYNTGNFSTGFANQGDIATGAFITGDMGNGAFWRGDQQGLFSAGYRVHVPEIPAHVTVEVPVNIPITASFTNTVYSGITLEQINFGFTIDIAGIPLLAGAISKAVLPPITGTGPAITVNIGDPGGSTAIRIPATASVGPFDVTFVNIAATTGFFNATTDPSSGFFNGGPGTVSGIANIGANISGFQNVANSATSGFNNYGSLQSGLANLGDTVSGVFNTG